MKQPVKISFLKGLQVRTALTFRSGNSSRWAPYCWPSSPVNPVRIPAGSPIHSHFLDTPFQPWHPAYVAPFKRNGQYFSVFSMLWQGDSQNNGCATTADQAIGGGSQSVKWKPAAYNLMDPQFSKLHWIKPKPGSENVQEKLVQSVRLDLQKRRFFCASTVVLFQCQSHDFPINLSLVLLFPKQCSSAQI